MSDIKTLQNIEKKLSAIVAILIEERENRASSKGLEKIEVILNNLGLTSADIASITGKNQGAVIKTLQRAKK